MKHSVPHDLDQATARRVAEKAWESYSQRFEKYHPEIRWVSEDRAEVSFRAKGLHLNGELDIRSSSIDMALDVPLLLRPFRKVAMQVIEEEVRTWVAKAKAGEV